MEEQVIMTLDRYESMKDAYNELKTMNTKLSNALFESKSEKVEIIDIVLDESICTWRFRKDKSLDENAKLKDATLVFAELSKNVIDYYAYAVPELIRKGLINKDYAIRFAQEKYAQCLMQNFGLEERL